MHMRTNGYMGWIDMGWDGILMYVHGCNGVHGGMDMELPHINIYAGAEPGGGLNPP